MEDANKPIKTALELALEKLKNEPLPEINSGNEHLRDEGRRWAAAFMRGDKIDFKQQLKKYKKDDVNEVMAGTQEILLLNIILPNSEKIKKECRRALEGIVLLRGSSPDVLQICGEIEGMLGQYLKQTQDYYKQLKEHFKQQTAMIQEQVASQMGRGVQIDAEQLPDFQKKWQELRGQLNEQYEPVFNELKAQLAKDR